MWSYEVTLNGYLEIVFIYYDCKRIGETSVHGMYSSWKLFCFVEHCIFSSCGLIFGRALRPLGPNNKDHF